ncbi:non-heme dioxygenase N-terminal domain-containing protein [Tanacetum coccineum]
MYPIGSSFVSESWLDTAYASVGYGNWGFLGVGTTLDIFQNIILIPYFEYGVLSLSGYSVLGLFLYGLCSDSNLSNGNANGTRAMTTNKERIENLEDALGQLQNVGKARRVQPPVCWSQIGDQVVLNHDDQDVRDRACIYPIKASILASKSRSLQEILVKYSSNIKSVNEVVFKALARSLNLEENFFLNQYGTTAKIHARFNYYPSCPWPEKVLGVKPHADGSTITVLLQDKEIEGLQLLKDDQWVGVPIVRDALTINVGDQIQETNIRQKDEKQSQQRQNRAQNAKTWKSQKSKSTRKSQRSKSVPTPKNT